MDRIRAAITEDRLDALRDEVLERIEARYEPDVAQA